MTPLEKEIETALRHMVARHDGVCLKWVCPGWAGVPDRLILLPGGRIIFAEIKRPKGGRIDPRQRWWRDKLESLGFEHHFVWCMRDVLDLGRSIMTNEGEGHEA